MDDSELTKQLIDEIKSLRDEISELKKTTGRMDNHIDFVENVYNMVKSPFMALMNTASMYLPRPTQIPEIEN